MDHQGNIFFGAKMGASRYRYPGARCPLPSASLGFPSSFLSSLLFNNDALQYKYLPIYIEIKPLFLVLCVIKYPFSYQLCQGKEPPDLLALAGPNDKCLVFLVPNSLYLGCAYLTARLSRTWGLKLVALCTSSLYR